MILSKGLEMVVILWFVGGNYKCLYMVCYNVESIWEWWNLDFF